MGSEDSIVDGHRRGAVGAFARAAGEPWRTNALDRGMRLGAHSFLWTAHFTGAEEAPFAEAAEHGFEAIEIAVSDPAAVSWGAVARMADRHGLAVILCMTQKAGLSLAAPDPAVRAAAVAHVASIAERARDLGVDIVTGPMLNPVGALTGRPPTRPERDALREGASALGSVAERHGMRFAIEPLNRFQGYLLTRVADGLALCRASGSDRIGLLLDLFHMNIEEADPAAAIVAAGDRCFHLHVSSCSRGAPGTDKADWPALRGALASIGYAGWITVEAFCFTEPDAVAAAHLWHPPSEASGPTAARSAAHLRRVFGAAEPGGAPPAGHPAPTRDAAP